MAPKTQPSILCVDDDPLVLNTEEEILHRDYKVTTALSGEQGLACVERDGPFEVIVSDMKMPGMDGAGFLRIVRERTPDTTRVLLTGEHDLDGAIKAVNEGFIFRFLTKPCPVNVLRETVAASVTQYRLVTAERVLLEDTLHGCVKTLSDVLAIANPVAFGRGLRARKYVDELAEFFGVPNRWQVDVAAMLSQIGCITLPYSTLDKLYEGASLTEAETEAVAQLPSIARHLLGTIPRMEPVVEAIVYQDKQFNGGGNPRDGVRGEAIPWVARALKIALDYDVLETAGYGASLALGTLRGRIGWYDPTILEAFATQRGIPAARQQVRDVHVRQLTLGMKFAADVRSRSGALLIGRGQEVSESLLQRLRNFADASLISGPLKVID